MGTMISSWLIIGVITVAAILAGMAFYYDSGPRHPRRGGLGEKWRECHPMQSRTYEIVSDGSQAMIRFHPCGVTSWNEGDIENRFCAFCGVSAAFPAPTKFHPPAATYRLDTEAWGKPIAKPITETEMDGNAEELAAELVERATARHHERAVHYYNALRDIVDVTATDADDGIRLDTINGIAMKAIDGKI